MAIVGGDDLVRRQQAAAAERAARDGDPDRGVAGRAVEAVGREERRRCPSASRASRSSGSGDLEAGRRAAEAGDVLGQLGRVAAADAQRLEDAVAELEAAIEDGQVGLVGRQEPAVDPDVTRSRRRRPSLIRPRSPPMRRAARAPW